MANTRLEHGGDLGNSPGGGSVLYVSILAMVAALGGLLFGYDTAVISGAIGFLQIHFDLDPQYWKGWTAASALVGCAAGAASAGMLSDGLGRKKVLVVSAILFFVSAIGTALPAHLFEFVVFRIVGGFAVGAASLTSPMYIAEISPARIRGRMVSINQLAIVFGMLVVFFVNYFIEAGGRAIDRRAAAETARQIVGERVEGDAAPDPDSTTLIERAIADEVAKEMKAAPESWNERAGWRWMFGSEALPAVLLLVSVFFVPESPRWLAKQRRPAEALAVLARVGGPARAKKELADIEDALAHESGSIAQLLLPGMRIVLVIGVVLAILQQVTGINVFLYYGPEIFKKMGSETHAALLQTVLVGAVNVTFTVIAIWTVDRIGRRPLMLVGFTGMGLALLGMGLAAYYQQTAVWVLVFILGYIACFALSVGPVTWVILSEIFPVRIRGRAMAIATVCLWVANYVVTQTFTMMDNDEHLVARFHHGFPFWVYAALCAVSVVFMWRCVPETKGRTLEQIEGSWTSYARCPAPHSSRSSCS